MLMHVTTHMGCTRIVRESALKTDSGKKNPLPYLEHKPVSVLRLALQSDVLPNELFLPLSGTLILSQGPINCYANEKEKK